MWTRGLVFSNITLRDPGSKQTVRRSQNRQTGHHAQADPVEFHGPCGLRPSGNGPVHVPIAFLPERVPRRLRERGRPAQTHGGGARGSGPSGGRAPQAGPDHLHHHVPVAVSPGAAHRVLHQLPT